MTKDLGFLLLETNSSNINKLPTLKRIQRLPNFLYLFSIFPVSDTLIDNGKDCLTSTYSTIVFGVGI